MAFSLANRETKFNEMLKMQSATRVVKQKPPVETPNYLSQLNPLEATSPSPGMYPPSTGGGSMLRSATLSRLETAPLSADALRAMAPSRTAGGSSDYLTSPRSRPIPSTAGQANSRLSFWEKDSTYWSKEVPKAVRESPDLPECFNTSHVPKRDWVHKRNEAVKVVPKPPRVAGSGNVTRWDAKVQEVMERQQEREREHGERVTEALFFGNTPTPPPGKYVLYSRPRAGPTPVEERGSNWWYRQQNRHEELATQSRVRAHPGSAPWVSTGGPSYLHAAEGLPPRPAAAPSRATVGGGAPRDEIVAQFNERRAAYERNRGTPSPIV